ncbi:MAG: hypothetical protein DDT37_01582 [Firmicutes bacterium]|nr:hypothetical protein [candidate division NPL-UPA2 bacterium]
MYGLIRMSVSCTTLATCPCTDSPLQAIMAPAIATRCMRGAPALAQSSVPMVISNKPETTLPERAPDTPITANGTATAVASKSTRPTTVAMRIITENKIMNPPMFSRLVTEVRTASPKSCPSGRPSCRRALGRARRALRTMLPAGTASVVAVVERR